MASTINAKTTGVGGIDASGDASGVLALQTGGTTAVTIDASQNVGIGTASPAGKLDVTSSNSQKPLNLYNSSYTSTTAFNNIVARLASNGSGADATINFTDSITYNAYIGMGSGNLYFATNGTTERMRIDSSGNVGIGTIPNGGFLTGNKFEINAGALGTTAGNISAATILNANDGNSTVLQTYNYRVSNGSNHTTSEWRQQRIVDATRMGYIGYGSSYISFGQNTTEQMRIDSSGVVLIGTTGGYATNPTSLGISNNSSTWQLMSMKQAYAGSACFINMANASTVGIGWDYGVGSSTSNWNWRYNAAVVSSIASATGVYTALSDANKKKDFELSTLGLDVVMGLKPTLFRMIDEEETAPLSLGFIAQDVQPLIPQAYVKQGEFIGLQDRPFIAVLTKAIQEQQALITTLQTQITALNAKVGI